MLTAIETRISARASDTLRAALLLATCGAAAWLASHASFATDLVLAPFVFAGLLSLTLWQGLYKLVATLNAGVRQAYCVALTLGSAGWLVVSAYLHSTGHDRLSGNSLKLSFALAASALLFSILRFEVSLMSAQERHSRRQRVLILGSGARASVAWRELRTRHRETIDFVGFVDNRATHSVAPDIAHRMVSDVHGLQQYLFHHIVDEIVIAAPLRSCYDMVESVVSLADSAGIHVSTMRDGLAGTDARCSRRNVGLFQNMTLERNVPGIGQAVKRILDISIAATLIVITAPLMTIIALGVKLTSPGPALFVQARVGLRRRSFPMFKFRSMVIGAQDQFAALECRNEAAGPLFKLRADPRITRFGGFLRRNSLDELPQLFNVLLGHMSLVGPRPMSLRDAQHICHIRMIKRFSVKPGVTGLWQVKGRSIASLDQWMALDSSYVDQWTVGLDLQLLVLTVPAVLRRSGAM